MEAKVVWELRSRVSAQMGKGKGGLLCDYMKARKHYEQDYHL